MTTPFVVPADAPEIFKQMIATPAPAGDSPYADAPPPDVPFVNTTAFDKQANRELVAEWADTDVARDIAAAMVPVLQNVERATLAARAAAVEAVGKSPERHEFVQAASELRQAHHNRAQRVAAVQADPNLSREGKTWHVAGATTRLDESVKELTAKLDGAVRRLAERFPDHTWPSPSAEITNEITLVYSRFPLVSPSFFAKEVLDVTRRAADPSTPAAEQFRCNQLLAHAFLPLIERRASAPEKHAQKLAPLALQLYQLVTAHLDAVRTSALTHRLAQDTAARLRADWRYATHLAQSTDEWDSHLMSVGAPMLYPAAPSA